jgi:hypothetical protein
MNKEKELGNTSLVNIKLGGVFHEEKVLFIPFCCVPFCDYAGGLWE